jgi:hypothetical protein
MNEKEKMSQKIKDLQANLKFVPHAEHHSHAFPPHQPPTSTHPEPLDLPPIDEGAVKVPLHLQNEKPVYMDELKAKLAEKYGKDE